MRFVITYRDQKRPEFPELIKKAFRSVKKFGHETVLVGSPMNGADEYIPTDKSEPHLSNWILYARQLYLKSDLFNCNSVFIDPDVLLVRPIEEVFEQDFDIAVTVRDVKSSPVNTGVVFVKPNNKEALIEFFERMRQHARGYPFNKQRWFSDQMAVNDLINDTSLKVLKLPCELYNASPCIEQTPEKIERNNKMAAEARILHFKGYRKNMMTEVWEAIAP